jgi:hypothetical protein
LIQTPHRLMWAPLKGRFEVRPFALGAHGFEALCRGFYVVSSGPEIRTVKTTIRTRRSTEYLPHNRTPYCNLAPILPSCGRS